MSPSVLFRPQIAAPFLLLALTSALPAQDDPAVVKAAADKATSQLAALRGKVAGNSAVSGFWIDKFSAGDKQVKVEGVFLNPAVDPKDGATAFEQLGADLAKLLQAELAVPTLRLDLSAVKQIEAKDQPHIALQKLANEKGGGGDEVMLDSTRFDSNGRMVVDGWVGSKDGSKWLTDATSKSKTPINIDNVKKIDWKLTPAAVQKVLAASDDVTLRRVRADRLVLAHRFTKGEGNRVGLSWNVGVLGLKVGEEGVEDKSLLAVLTQVWPELFKRQPEVRYDFSALSDPRKRVPEALAEVRKAVSAEPALDGTWVADGLEFSTTGELSLAGLQPGLDATGSKSLLDTINRALKTQATALGADGPPFEKLTERGLATSRMTTVSTPKLLSDVRAWTAANLEDVRIGRLHFDPVGTLRLNGQAAHAADEPRIGSEFSKLVSHYFPQSKPAAAPKADPKAEPKAATTPLLGDKPVPHAVNVDTKFPAFTSHLRQQLAKNQAAWRGVMLERGYFDAGDRYTLVGLVNQSNQNAALDKLIDAQKSVKEFEPYFVQSPNPAALTPMALDPMLARIKRVAPGYAVFDGMIFEDVRHDGDSKLTFGLRTVGPTANAAATTKLTELLKSHPDWKRRAGRGIVLDVPADKAVPSTFAGLVQARHDAVFALIRGLPAEARPLVDHCLLHERYDSSLWYLSAYIHYLAGEHELVRRDLFRVAGLERETEELRYERGDVIERLQGKERRAVDELLEEYRRELRSGKEPIDFVGRR